MPTFPCPSPFCSPALPDIPQTTAVDADKRPYLACSALVRHLRCSQGYNCCDKAAANCMQALVDQLQVKVRGWGVERGVAGCM
jgi:hypothetical protein